VKSNFTGRTARAAVAVFQLLSGLKMFFFCPVEVACCTNKCEILHGEHTTVFLPMQNFTFVAVVMWDDALETVKIWNFADTFCP